ncbi:hypothetical protein KAR91_06085 [Candidatus Pacearchaeota archaeon]|nr:hypothetical protein [Candidatus Pacearchaeota archaeon]
MAIKLSIQCDIAEEEKQQIKKIYKNHGLKLAGRTLYLIRKDINELERKD